LARSANSMNERNKNPRRNKVCWEQRQPVTSLCRVASTIGKTRLILGLPYAGAVPVSSLSPAAAAALAAERAVRTAALMEKYSKKKTDTANKPR
jgi:hypothetical protein